MEKDTKNRIIKRVIGIIVIIIILIIIDYIVYTTFDFRIPIYNFVLFLLFCGPIILSLGIIVRDEIRSKQVDTLIKEEKYIICPKCKEIVDDKTGICSSCGYKL
ncbi:hypothetical protein ES703_32468 [subsurface metagenome]